MLLIDCPHCYTRVVPKPDGSCPACQKDVRDKTDAEASYASVRVGQGDLLPAICCGCGKATSRVVAVYQKASPQGKPSTLLGVIVFALFSWSVGMWLMLRGIADTTVVDVKLPQCEHCAEQGPPQPRHVDFANARMTFVVHKNLRDAMTD